MMYHLSAMFIAYIMDRLIGDPENWPHPVKGFGRLISGLDNRMNKGKGRKWKGTLMTLIVMLVVFVSSFFFTLLCYRIHPICGVIVEGLLVATTISATNLKQAAQQVYEPLRNKDIETARQKLSYIVGRDTEQLSEEEIVRGTVETVAENTSDGITAPLFWSLIGGAPFALVYRAVNTCDSMVGYQNERYGQFGYFSAKLDDVLNWIPARLTAVIMILVTRPVMSSHRKAWVILFRDARKHKSPNSGWGEAAVAALLGIQLGGTNTYQGEQSVSKPMGNANRKRTHKHILQTIMIMERTVLLFLLLSGMGGILIELAITRI